MTGIDMTLLQELTSPQQNDPENEPSSRSSVTTRCQFSFEHEMNNHEFFVELIKSEKFQRTLNVQLTRAFERALIDHAKGGYNWADNVKGFTSILNIDQLK